MMHLNPQSPPFLTKLKCEELTMLCLYIISFLGKANKQKMPARHFWVLHFPLSFIIFASSRITLLFKENNPSWVSKLFWGGLNYCPLIKAKFVEAETSEEQIKIWTIIKSKNYSKIIFKKWIPNKEKKG